MLSNRIDQSASSFVSPSSLVGEPSSSLFAYSRRLDHPIRHYRKAYNDSSPRSISPPDIFSPPQTLYLDNNSVGGDEPRYQLPLTMPPIIHQVRRNTREGTNVNFQNQVPLLPHRPTGIDHLRRHRPWGSGVDYPPPTGEHFSWTDDVLFKPEPEHTSGIEVDKMMANYELGNKELEERLAERSKTSTKLRRELREKMSLAHDYHEDLQNLKMFPGETLRPGVFTETCSNIERVEDDISEIKERLEEHRLESEDVILQGFGYEPEKRTVVEPAAFCCLAKPVSQRGTTPGLVVQKHKIQGDSWKPLEILVPDWFAVFATYNLVQLSNAKPMAERYRELLNVIHNLEDAIENNKAKAKKGMTKSTKKWHEPAPGWEQPIQRKNGG